MRSRFTLALGACAVVAIAACSDSNGPTTSGFSGLLNGTKIKPTPTTAVGSGSFSAIIANDTLTYFVGWGSLSAPQTGAHLHGPADANSVGDVLIDFSSLPTAGATDTLIYEGSFVSGTNGSATGKIYLGKNVTPTVSGDSLRKLFDAGMVYVDVHTPAHSEGEIRTQVQRK